MDLTGMQKMAIRQAENWYKDVGRKQVFTVSGYAGTGKTTIVDEMVSHIGIKENTKFVTFTGKASLVLNQRGCKATTLHHLMYDLVEYIDPKTLRRKFKFEKKMYLDSSIKLVVVDEVPMVNLDILNDLLSFGIPVIAIGDPKQLPPIGKDNKLLDNPDAFLSEIHRQAQDNPIIHLSMLAREGRRINFGMYGKTAAVIEEDQLTDKTLLTADQIICGKNNTRRIFNDRMRGIKRFNGELPVVGDKLICVRNNWGEMVEDFSLINGMVGYVDKIGSFDPRKDTFIMDFRPDFLPKSKFRDIEVDMDTFRGEAASEMLDSRANKFDFGYAITCHKSQGSGFNKVILFEEVLNPENHSRWLYTGITRAADKLIIVKRKPRNCR